MIALPALAGLVAVILVLPGLPKVFRSTTFLTLTPPTISEKVAPSLTDETMSHRLQSIGSNVLSRSSLEAIIDQFDLYSDKKAAGLPKEAIVDGMRNNIEVDPEKRVTTRLSGFGSALIILMPTLLSLLPPIWLTGIFRTKTRNHNKARGHT